jgi:hypothetical protein
MESALRKFLAALLISALCPLSASALELSLDGVTLSLPDGNEFLVSGWGWGKIEPGRLQEHVNDLRAIPSDRVSPLFESRSTASADRATSLFLIRDTSEVPFYRAALGMAREVAVFSDGVAKLDVKRFNPRAPDHRVYAVQTGIDTAPEAYASCFNGSSGLNCFVHLPLVGRERLLWTGIILNEGDPLSMREELRDLVGKTVRKGRSNPKT